jgi:hypothetical protein
MQTPQTKQARHTAGKWRYCMFSDHMPDFVIKSGNRKIAKVNYFAGNPEFAATNDITEGEANARLIEAAPELLGALQEALAEFDAIEQPVRPWTIKARNAIAHATGE